MPSYLFPASVLLFLLVFCALCGSVSAESANKSAKLFGRGIIDVLQPKGDSEERINVGNFALPSLVGTGDVMVALVEATRYDGKRDILTKYIETQGDNWSERAIEDNGKNWEAQWALKSEKRRHIAFAPVAKNNSIYILSASKEQFAPPSPQRTTNTKTWDFQLTIGTITDATGKRIEWDTKDVSDRFATDIQGKLQGVFPFDGSAFLMEDGTFVFVLRALNRTSRKFVFVIAHSRDPGSDFTFNFVDTTAADCYSSFFSWGEQLFMAPNYCFGRNSSDYKVKESNDMGETWREATGRLAEKLDYLTNGREFFTPIIIEGRRVLLFTEEGSDSGVSHGNVNISVLMGDKNDPRVLGPILTNVTRIHGGSFVYTNDELFFFGVRYGDFNVVITQLKKQLGKIKRLLSTWYRDDS